MDRHRYWTVECRTADCALLLLADAGRVDPLRFPLLPECRSFSVTCPDCRKTAEYSRKDVHAKECAWQEDFRDNPSFLDAIRSQPPQGESVSSVAFFLLIAKAIRHTPGMI